MKKLTKEQFTSEYSVGDQILWNNQKGTAWLPGVVVEVLYPSGFDPSVWFHLDDDPEGESWHRFISYKYQQFIKGA